MTKYKYLPTIYYLGTLYTIGDYILVEMSDYKTIYCGEIISISPNIVEIKHDKDEKRGKQGQFLIDHINNIYKVEKPNESSYFDILEEEELGTINCKDDMDMNIW